MEEEERQGRQSKEAVLIEENGGKGIWKGEDRWKRRWEGIGQRSG